MKKIFLLTMAMAVIGSVVAQSTDARDARQEFYLGIKAGYSVSKIYAVQGDMLDAKSKLGFTAGLFAALPLNRLVGIQPEISFAQRGFRASGMLLGSSYELTRTTSYLEFPLLLAIKPNRIVTLLSGPQIAYTIKQKDVFVNSPNSVQQEEEFKTDDLRKNTWCLVGGVDINFHPLIIGFRTCFDLQRNSGDGSSIAPRYKNVWMQGTFGMRF